MIVTVLLAFIIVTVLVTTLVGAGVLSKRRAETAFIEEEKAFEEQIRPNDSAQLQRLAPLVHEVRVISVMSTGQSHYDAPEGDQYHIFVIDSVGAVHDVLATYDFRQAQAIARRVAAELRVELVDEAGLLR